jgi:hypothetical protein
VSLGYQGILRDAFTEVSCFRTDLYSCLTARGDALFELCDALLCTDGLVRTLASRVVLLHAQTPHPLR